MKISRHIISLGIAALVFLTAYTQQPSGKTFLEISAGPSFPLGNFGSTAPRNLLSGYAKTGQTMNISFGYRLRKSLAITAMLSGQRTPLNTAVMAQQLSQGPIYFGFNSGQANYYNWKLDKETWYAASLLAGIMDDMPLSANGKTGLSAKALIGVVNLRAPKADGAGVTDTSYAVMSHNGGSGFGLSYAASLGVTYQLSSRSCLTAGLSYFGTGKIPINNITEIIAATNGGLVVPNVYSLSNSRLPPQQITAAGSTHQVIGVLNVNLGIRIKL